MLLDSSDFLAFGPEYEEEEQFKMEEKKRLKRNELTQRIKALVAQEQYLVRSLQPWQQTAIIRIARRAYYNGKNSKRNQIISTQEKT